MSGIDLDRVREVLIAVLDVAPGERDAAIEQLCNGDRELAAEARRLLRHESATDALPPGAPDATQPGAPDATPPGTPHATPSGAIDASPPGGPDATPPGKNDASRQRTTGAPGGTPTRLGRYAITGQLGAGGMGVVYLAQDPVLRRPIAIKHLPAWLAAGRAALERFQEEARLLAQLNHPNIATIYSLETDADDVFLTMEYIEGLSLSERFRRAPLELNESLQLLRQLVGALEAAHRCRIAHRDLKPQNVMLTESGVVKVLDFGLARLLDENGSSRDAGPPPQPEVPGDSPTRSSGTDGTGSGTELRSWSSAGTPGYMSPERVLGHEDDIAGDVWAFGCVLYECLSGTRAFEGTPDERLLATVEAEPPVTRLPSGTPRKLRDLVARCLTRDPSARLPSMRAARRSIETVIEARELDRLRRRLDRQPRRSRLPEPLTRFFGRAAELDALTTQLGDHRLVTILGLGGTGKTRLAVELARRYESQESVTAAWIDVSAAGGDEHVITTTLAALGARNAGRDPITEIHNRLGDTAWLLVFDNCETHSVACSELIEAVLPGCPNVRAVATSREALGVPGECLFTLSPLPTPKEPGHQRAEHRRGDDDHGGQYAPGGDHDPRGDDDHRGDASMALFVDRVAAIRPTFRLTDRNRATIADICRRLEGIPLALELAAAHADAIDVSEIRDRLDHRLRLLARRTRTGRDRQASLRSVLDWSFERLEPDARRMLCRLSTFAGSWTLGGAEAVGHGEASETWRTLDLVSALVRASLIERVPVSIDESGTSGRTRYRMLDTVREYASEELDLSGNAAAARTALLRYYMALFERPDTFGSEQTRWMRRYLDEEENIRGALAHISWDLVSSLDVAAFANQLVRFWTRLGRWSEARGYLGTIRARLVADGHGDTVAHAHALRADGDCARAQGDLETAHDLAIEGLRIAEASNSPLAIGALSTNLGNVERLRGNFDRALEHYDRRLALGLDGGSEWDYAGVRLNRGVIMASKGRWEDARIDFTESLRLKRRLDDTRGVSHALNALGILARFVGKTDEAIALFEESLALKRAVDDRAGLVNTLLSLGNVTLDRVRLDGDSRAVLEEAAGWLREGLALAEEMGDQPNRQSFILALGSVSHLAGDLDDAEAKFLDAKRISREFGGATFEAWALTRLSIVDADRGRFESAWARALEALDAFVQAKTQDVFDTLGALAIARAGLGDRLEAATLLSSAYRVTDAMNVQMPPGSRYRLDSLKVDLRGALSEVAFDEAWRQGQALTPAGVLDRHRN